MVSLVYPSVYPANVDGRQSKNWRGSGRFFRFRPSHQYQCASGPQQGPGASLQIGAIFYKTLRWGSDALVDCDLLRSFGVDPGRLTRVHVLAWSADQGRSNSPI